MAIRFEPALKKSSMRNTTFQKPVFYIRFLKIFFSNILLKSYLILWLAALGTHIIPVDINGVSSILSCIVLQYFHL